MRYFELFEQEDTVTLYRGDSQRIEKFIFDLTDHGALFGMGVYLTDSRAVAGDYVRKGVNKVFPSYNSKIHTRTYKDKGSLIRGYLLELVYTKTDFEQRAKDINYDMSPTAWSKSPEEANAIKIEIQNLIHKELERCLQEIKPEWNAAKKELTIVKDTLGEYSLQKKSTGAVSTFVLPRSYIDKTLNGEAPLPDAALKAIRASWEYYIKTTGDDTVAVRPFASTYKTTIAPFDEFVANYKNHGLNYKADDDGNRAKSGGNGENPSLDDIMNNIDSSYTVWKSNKEVQKYLIGLLVRLGYTGVSYVGGNRVGSNVIRGGGGHTHSAYNLWDTEFVNAHRVGEENITDPEIKSAGNKVTSDNYPKFMI